MDELEYEAIGTLKPLLGKVMLSVEQIGDDGLVLTADDGTRYTFQHYQDCCESVRIESIVGDLADLVGSPILLAEGVTSDKDPEWYKSDYMYRDSFTWTFYKFATVKGYVDVRWLGESNGYYSESVGLLIERP